MESDQQHKFEVPPVPASAPVAPAVTATPAAAPEPITDLSVEIAAAIGREPGDRVRVTWISGCNYRCNWWASEAAPKPSQRGMDCLIATVQRVRKSQFLSVTKVGGGLLINDRSGRDTVPSGGR